MTQETRHNYKILKTEATGDVIYDNEDVALLLDVLGERYRKFPYLRFTCKKNDQPIKYIQLGDKFVYRVNHGVSPTGEGYTVWEYSDYHRVDYINDDKDKTIIATQYIKTGQNSTDPVSINGVTPISTKNENSVFSGWKYTIDDVEYTGPAINVRQDIQVYAQYDAKTFTVNFINYNNEIIKTATCRYGESVEPPVISDNEMPTGYILNSWDGMYVDVTRDSNVFAVYTKRIYQVEFIIKKHIWDAVLQDFSGYETTHLATHQCTYHSKAYMPTQNVGDEWIWNGWNELSGCVDYDNSIVLENVSLDDVTGNISAYAILEPRLVNVTFKCFKDDTQQKINKLVQYNSDITNSIAPDCINEYTKTGHTFKAWNPILPCKADNDTMQMLVEADYDANGYNVKYIANTIGISDFDDDWDPIYVGGNDLTVSDQIISYGLDSVVPDIPERTYWIADKWTPENSSTNITSNRSITATYKPDLISIIYNSNSPE